MKFQMIKSQISEHIVAHQQKVYPLWLYMRLAQGKALMTATLVANRNEDLKSLCEAHRCASNLQKTPDVNR